MASARGRHSERLLNVHAPPLMGFGHNYKHLKFTGTRLWQLEQLNFVAQSGLGSKFKQRQRRPLSLTLDHSELMTHFVEHTPNIKTLV